MATLSVGRPQASGIEHGTARARRFRRRVCSHVGAHDIERAALSRSRWLFRTRVSRLPDAGVGWAESGSSAAFSV